MPVPVAEMKMSVEDADRKVVEVPYDPAVLGIVRDGAVITHPLYSPDGTKIVDPKSYGFQIWSTGGDQMILGMNLPNGDHLHLTDNMGVYIPDEEDVESGIIGRYTKDGDLVACAVLKDVPIQK